MTTSRDPIVVYGSGLAGNMAAISLAKSLGRSWPVVQICPPGPPVADAFYGGATAPTAYNFLLNLGLDEPNLVLNSSTAFSFGTQFHGWLDQHSWMQCHHAPLPTPNGTALRHLLARFRLPLEPLLVSAQAALAGRFAHPPTDPKSMLSRAEYGFQFSPREWAALLRQQLGRSTVKLIDDDIGEIELLNSKIDLVRLKSGASIKPGLVIDASGPARSAILGAHGQFTAQRHVAARLLERPVAQLGPAYRTLEATATGWTATTRLQTKEHSLVVGSPEDSASPSDFEIALGQLDDAWVGNCVAIGQAAATMEPLTPAPMIALQRDIERLLALVPTPAGMAVERAEFNRRYREDVAHLNLFQGAILRSSNLPDRGYWRAVGKADVDPRLDLKIAQFKHRGTLVSYDLEPFNEEDWTILHLGQGRIADNIDRMAGQMPEADARQMLSQMRTMIEQLVPRIPPHHLYMTKLKQYLDKQNHG